MDDYQSKLAEIESQSAGLLESLTALERETNAYAQAENKLTDAGQQLTLLIDSTKNSIVETQNLIRISKDLSAPEIINYLNNFSGHLENINSRLASIELLKEDIAAQSNSINGNFQAMQEMLIKQEKKTNLWSVVSIVIGVVILILQIVLLTK